MSYFQSVCKKYAIVLLIISVLPLQSAISTTNSEQRIIPFIGMKVEYKLNVYIEGLFAIPFPVTANWTIFWDKYNSSHPDIFISNLTVQSSYISLFTDIDKESGIIIENISSREVISVNLGESIVLDSLYSTYYSPTQKNFTPFYINTTNIKINDSIDIYNYSMQIVATDRINVQGFGFRDVWVVQKNVTNLSYVEHYINLVYDNRTGVLVGGRLYTHWFWEDEDTDYKFSVQIICQSTNALSRHIVYVKTNEILVIAISCIPILPVSVKISRTKEIKGGL